MRALASSFFPGITRNIDDNVGISRAKLENTSLIFFQLKLSNRELQRTTSDGQWCHLCMII